MEISESTLKVVEIMNNYLKGIVCVNIVSSEMEWKYPDSYSQYGYLGVEMQATIEIIKKKYDFFFKNDDIEYILSINAEEEIKHVMTTLLRNDLTTLKSKLELMAKNINRKQKLKEINLQNQN